MQRAALEPVPGGVASTPPGTEALRSTGLSPAVASALHRLPAGKSMSARSQEEPAAPRAASIPRLPLERRLLALLAFLPLAAALPAPAASQGGALPAGTGDGPRVPPSFAAVSDLLHRFVEEGTIAGAVAGVVRRDGLLYLEAVGVSDRESGRPMDPGTLFRIYSMTKPVTAVAVMMLVEEGALSLDDAVEAYLPELASVHVRPDPEAEPRPPARPITVRDLLLHTSGMSHRTSALYRELGVRSRADSLPRFVERIAAAPLLEDPGTRFRYSEATTVAGRLVEVASGLPLDRFFQERILRPLDMADTGFHVPLAQAHRLATVYGPGEWGDLVPVELEELPFTEVPALLEGAVGLVSTVPDYLRFGRMLLARGELDGVRLLRPETVDLMVSNGLSDEILALRPGTMGWGLANVNVVLEPEGLPWPATRGEYGWDGTAGTVFWVNPAGGTVIVLMTQSSPPNPRGLRQAFRAAVEEALAR